MIKGVSSLYLSKALSSTVVCHSAIGNKIRKIAEVANHINAPLIDSFVQCPVLAGSLFVVCSAAKRDSDSCSDYFRNRDTNLGGTVWETRL